MDKIFKALNDTSRRLILDSLRIKDGQTLSELESQHDMSRFGVMKHLGVLEDAGLISTKKVGRFKYHYLNAVPLQEVIDRWIEPFVAKPVARGMLNLKRDLEEREKMQTNTAKPDFIHQTLIRCSQDSLWDALTNADQIAAYHFACDRAQGNAQVGKPTDLLREDGSLMLRQTTTQLMPKTRIESTFEPHWFDGNTAPSRIVFEIKPEGEHCLLTCEHYDIPVGQEGVKEGWARHIASLKSWLETGEPIKMAAA